MIVIEDVVKVELTKDELDICIDTAKNLSNHIIDRKNLHGRDDLERFINVLTGEIAEQMVLKWLHENGRQAESAVDKQSNNPDLGHDIRVFKIEDGSELLCSIKSSLSCEKDLKPFYIREWLYLYTPLRNG